MGQYYVLANIDRQEYIHGHEIGGGIKLWEWAANPQGAVLTLLCGWSNEAGGGDPDWEDEDIKKIAGRWAGNRIIFVGDYFDPEKEDRGIPLPSYTEVKETYQNISDILVPAWNKFIELDDMKLEYRKLNY
jgi:hypothetical protein